MCLINYQPWQYCCYWDERAREIWNRPSENFLESLVQITHAALAALACLFTFTFEWMLLGLSLAYKWIYPIETVAPPRVIALDEFHGLVDVHAPDGTPDEWLIEEINRPPYAEPPANLDRVPFFRDAMQEALRVLAPHTRAHYVDLFRNQGVPEEGDARIEIYTYSAGCLIAHYCRYPIAHRDQDLIYAAFQELPPLDKALVLLRLLAPEKEWRLTDAARNTIQRIQQKALNMSQDQVFLREVMVPVALHPELYPLEP